MCGNHNRYNVQPTLGNIPHLLPPVKFGAWDTEETGMQPSVEGPTYRHRGDTGVYGVGYHAALPVSSSITPVTGS